MPLIKLQAGAKAAEAKAARVGYTGPRPPKGVYRVMVKRLSMTINKNGDFMLNAVCEIDEPKGTPKSKFNGYGVWWNGNCTEEGAGYINQFLDSITGGKSEVKTAFWGGKIKCFDTPKKGHKAIVQAIGPFRVNQDGMKAVINTRLNKPHNGSQELGVADWLLPSQVTQQQAEEADGEIETDEVDIDAEDGGDGVEVEQDEDGDAEADGDDDADDSIEYTDEDDNEPPF